MIYGMYQKNTLMKTLNLLNQYATVTDILIQITHIFKNIALGGHCKTHKNNTNVKIKFKKSR